MSQRIACSTEVWAYSFSSSQSFLIALCTDDRLQRLVYPPRQECVIAGVCAYLHLTNISSTLVALLLNRVTFKFHVFDITLPLLHVPPTCQPGRCSSPLCPPCHPHVRVFLKHHSVFWSTQLFAYNNICVSMTNAFCAITTFSRPIQPQLNPAFLCIFDQVVPTSSGMACAIP